MEKTLFNSMVAEVRVELYPKIPTSQMQKITGSQDAYNIFSGYWSEIGIRERMMVLYLNRANKVLGIREVSSGGITGTVVDARTIFQGAIGCNACCIILAHNHPSGNTCPSDADKHITQKIMDAGKILDIQLLDHLILSPDSGYYRSFADEGEL